MKFYVYVHRRKDTNEVFYVGKGCGKRAWKKTTRSDWWKRIEAKYGRTVEIVLTDMSEDDAFKLENGLIDFYGRENLCNLTDGGMGGVSPNAETREKMSVAGRGRKRSEETREKMRAAATGRKHSEQTKQKIKEKRASQVMTSMSEESRKKISVAQKGKKRTPEQCLAISLGKKGKKIKPMSAERLAAFKVMNVGRKHTELARANIAKAQIGKVDSPETIAKKTERNRITNQAFRKPVKCSNGMVFGYAGEAESWLRANGFVTAQRSNVSSCCSGHLKTAYGFTWQFVE